MLSALKKTIEPKPKNTHKGSPSASTNKLNVRQKHTQPWSKSFSYRIFIHKNP